MEGMAGGPALLIGAGFNADASLYVEELRETVKYPMGSDLARLAFGQDSIPAGSSIEQWFQQALDAGDRVTLERMCQAVLKADHYVTEGLLGTALSWNPYASFLEEYSSSDFMTFKYDGLLEILLLNSQSWTPEDGFGMPVRASRSSMHLADTNEASHQGIVHLHGSLYVYARESDLSSPDSAGVQWLTMRENTDFVFDPDSTGYRFLPFTKATMDQNFKQTHERIIAPIPNKTIHLKQEFVTKSYQIAESIVQQADHIVCVGYNFNAADKDSYASILALAKRCELPITVVTPNARTIVTDVKREFGINAEPYSGTFAEWSEMVIRQMGSRRLAGGLS
jgi:hypothetical protein